MNSYGIAMTSPWCARHYHGVAWALPSIAMTVPWLRGSAGRDCASTDFCSSPALSNKCKTGAMQDLGASILYFRIVDSPKKKTS